MRSLSTVAFLLLSLGSVSCGGSSSAQKPTPTPRAVERFDELPIKTVVPLADGGALVFMEFGGGDIWYVQGSEAMRVREVEKLGGVMPPVPSTPRERALWAELQHEIQKRKAAEAPNDAARHGD